MTEDRRQMTEVRGQRSGDKKRKILIYNLSSVICLLSSKRY